AGGGGWGGGGGRGAGGARGRHAASRRAWLDRPAKRPRQRTKPPTPPWRDAPQTAQTAWRHGRLVLEQALGGRHRESIVVPVFRTRTVACEEDAVGIWAGLWNFALSY